jgi:hypothetical protein
MEQIVYNKDYVHHIKNKVVFMVQMVHVYLHLQLVKYKEQNHVE